MKSALMWGVGLTFLVAGACTTEVQNRRAFTGITASDGTPVDASCDDPAKYGADCTGDHDNPVTSSDQVAEKPADTPAADKPADPAATPPATPPAAPANPNVVEFKIAAGTGTTGAWNTAAAPINAKVGMTIKIINMDSVPHRLHTGGAPCPHGPANIPPGGSMDCVASRALTTNAANPQTYEHNANNGSPVFFNVVP